MEDRRVYRLAAGYHAGNKEPLIYVTVVSLIRGDQRTEGSVHQRFFLSLQTN